MSITVLVLFSSMAVIFAQIGSLYDMQSVYATEESDPPQNTDVAEVTDSPDTEETETSSPTDTPADVPLPSDSDDTEKPDDTDEPQPSEEPDDITPGESSTPSAETTTPDSIKTETPAASVVESILPQTPGIVTPSPTLAGIEEPVISGNTVVDVEKETYVTDAENTDMVIYDDLLDDSESSHNSTATKNSEDSGFFAALFDVLVYFFIGCAIVSAGFSVYILVRIMLNKKKQNKK